VVPEPENGDDPQGFDGCLTKSNFHDYGEWRAQSSGLVFFKKSQAGRGGFLSYFKN
jgi:hypothetical protein